MLSPTTPVTRRVAPPTAPATPADRDRRLGARATPSAPSSPAVRPRTRNKSEASASPQVKAAIAAMRKNNRPPPPASSLEDAGDPFAQPSQGRAAPGATGAEWGFKSLATLLDTAKRTGRLNVSSRDLSSLPAEAFSTLMPITSPFHPSNRPTTVPSSRIAPVNFSIAIHDDGGGTEWYQQVDLKSLVAGNNEITELEEEIAGFEDLETLDLHNNLLASLPASLGLMKTLTSLNLAANALTAFPFPLLSLAALRDLNLASNKIPTLWPADWKPLLDSVGPPVASPSATPESTRGAPMSDFWDAFPSSPTKPGSASAPSRDAEDSEESLPERARPSTAPFPALVKLVLSDNPLAQTVFSEPGFALPPRLADLDLSDCTLPSLPLSLLLSLSSLSSLDLSGNPLSSPSFLLPAVLPSRPILPSLTTLNLSRTPLESLGPLDDLLIHHVRRPVEWVGLSKVVMNLVRSGVARETSPRVGLRLEVRVLECPLRDEQRRRRATFDAPVPPPPAAAIGEPTLEANNLPAQVADTSLDVLVEVEPASEVQSPPEVGAPPPAPDPSVPSTPVLSLDDSVLEASATDPAVVLVSSGLLSTTTRRQLALANLGLDALPIPATGTTPPRTLCGITSLDLSGNAFASLPVAEIGEWGWSSTLLTLSVARNRLAQLAVGDPFAGLRDLDLSTNRITSAPLDGVPFLSALGALAPNLVTLDLSNNALTTTDGIGALLVPAGEGRAGVRELRLHGNQIADLEGLCEVAQGIERNGTGSWRCLVLDLERNAIARLPPTLGLLPHTVSLLVNGNTFRIPRQEVYENGGSRGLLAWLKDRC